MRCIIWFALALQLTIGPAKATLSNTSLQIAGTANPGDTVKIHVWDHYFGELKQYVLKHREFQHHSEDGSFRFEFRNIKNPVYFTIVFKQGRKVSALEHYLAMPGDSININQVNYKSFSFTGRGAEAMLCRYEMDSVGLRANTRADKISRSTVYLTQKDYPGYLKAAYANVDSNVNARLAVLEDYRRLIRAEQYAILLADVTCLRTTWKYSSYNYAKAVSSAALSPDSAKAIAHELGRHFLSQAIIPSAIPGKVSVISKGYLDAQVSVAVAHANLNTVEKEPAAIMKRLKGTLRDRVLCTFILQASSRMESLDSVMKEALKVIKTPYCREPLQFYLTNYLRGTTAYNFALQDTSGKIRRLSDFRGKKVVIDFWYTGCLGCIGFYKNALKAVEENLGHDTTLVFLSIADDEIKKTWTESIKKDIYTSASIINLFTAQSKYTHPAIKKFGIKAFPTLVIVDQKGKILYNDSAPRDVDGLTRIIRSN